MNWSAIGALAGVVGALVGVAALLWAFFTWAYPNDNRRPDPKVKPSTGGSAPAVIERKVDTRRISTDLSTSASASRADLSEFELADGEQRVILAGQASVAVDFTSVGEEHLLTLRVATGSESVPYPVLDAGERVSLAVGGKTFYVSVLRIDRAHKTVVLRIDQKT